ncbi:phosphoglycerate mutase family protein [Microbacterium sp. M28]|uniref:histidine phosphatase family protein n=1 Tax=Microbacterium sp. M28 TaxID=2962064 RepID=UPI0021F44EFB|nr:histidine phosphatase family protein [Microbacterium sp. M28]UYO98462.1 phosphoglycerate mutase family protein [Microbacterium sp. M28]
MIPRDRHVPQRAYLARCGQTAWNLEGRLQGRRDSPLTADGLAQAADAAQRLDGSGIRTVCTSPLGRAMATALIIAERLGADLVEVADLAELDHGEMAGMTWSEIEEVFPGARAERAENRYGWAFPGGESYAQARLRARRALSECGWVSDGAPLIVAHEMIGRMLRAELRGLDASGALSLRHPHGLVFEIDGGVERVV